MTTFTWIVLALALILWARCLFVLPKGRNHGVFNFAVATILLVVLIICVG